MPALNLKQVPIFACLVCLGCLSAFAADEPAPDFQAVGRTFLESHCLECHRDDQRSGELTLEPFDDAINVWKARKTFEQVAKLVQSGEMPPKDKPRPEAEEIDAFVGLIKQVLEYGARNAKPDPGRVTMRRLNRVEYRNTVADLFGVDFDPTEDFPSDDVGHGFDNIGDVLSVSPILMERYLAAAESITARAIMPIPVAPPERYTQAHYTEPASSEVEKRFVEGEYRRMVSDSTEDVASGPLHVPFNWTEDGEYKFRTRVYGNGNESKPIKFSVIVTLNGEAGARSEEKFDHIVGRVRTPAKSLGEFTVTATSKDNAQLIEMSVPAMPFRDRISIALHKPDEGSPPSALYVQHFALTGPLDTRPASHRRLLAHTDGQDDAARTREVLTRFLRKAYRRPATTDEVDRLMQATLNRMQNGDAWEVAMQFAFQATLCSPKFLFRAELDDRPLDGPAAPLDSFQLASRLSYFLWSTMPDEELLALAEQNKLREQLPQQIRRMLADPRSRALVDNFGMQWLQLRRLDQVSPDNKTYASFDESLRRAMRTETQMFLESIIHEDRSILELLDADYTFLNERLANHYGIADTQGNWMGQADKRPGGEPFTRRDFKRVSLQGKSRGGLLTQASILTVTSNPTRTSPVKRGRWVLEQILGAPPPPPPPNVPELEDAPEHASGGSLRERMEAHRSNPSCAGCHAKMDPLGFAFENYDGVGAFRQKDGEFVIDPAGQLTDGTHFQGPEELKQILRGRADEFARCLTEKMLIYSLGRGLEYYDQAEIDRIVAELKQDEYRFSSVVLGIVSSKPFQMRRGSDAESR